MKPGDKVWRGEYGRVDCVKVVAVEGAYAAIMTPKWGLAVCPLERLFATKKQAVAATSGDRIKDMRKHYESIERAHESFRNMAKQVLEAFEAADGGDFGENPRA